MVEHIDVAILKQNLHEINSKSLYVGYNATLNALLRSISDGQVAQSKWVWLVIHQASLYN